MSTPASRKSREASTGAVFSMTVALANIQPIIWRQLEVSATASLQELHEVIQVAMGWTNSHLYEFAIAKQTYRASYIEHEYEGENFKAASSVTLHELGLRAGSRFTYKYDFGDSWVHEIKVERVEPADPLVFYPRCTDGAMAAPPEDCGGAGGYEDLQKALADPAHPEHTDSWTWVGDDFAPTRFDQNAVNVRLAAWWARHMYFSLLGPHSHRFEADQLEWLALADLENRCPPPPWLG